MKRNVKFGNHVPKFNGFRITRVAIAPHYPRGLQDFNIWECSAQLIINYEVACTGITDIDSQE